MNEKDEIFVPGHGVPVGREEERQFVYEEKKEVWLVRAKTSYTLVLVRRLPNSYFLRILDWFTWPARAFMRKIYQAISDQ